MSNKIITGKAARLEMAKGISKMAEVIGSTMGPFGQNVVIDKLYGDPVTTNDGVTIVKDFELDDPIQNLGVKMVKEAATKTNDIAGDGTTTATILADALISTGNNLLNQDKTINPLKLIKGMQIAKEEVLNSLKESKTMIEIADVKNLATISSGDEKIGELMYNIFSQIGKDGSVDLNNSNNTTTTFEIKNGSKFSSGLASTYYVENKKNNSIEMQEPLVFLFDKRLDSIDITVAMLQISLKDSQPIVIIAPEFDDTVFQTLIQNYVKQTARNCVIKLSNADIENNLLDLETILGCKRINRTAFPELFNTNVSLEDLIMHAGQCKKLTADLHEFIITQNDDPVILQAIKERANDLNKQLEKPECSQIVKDLLKKRICNLYGKIAVVSVGAPTEIELTDKKLKIEDAMHASKVALEDGIVIGGGYALHDISKNMQYNGSDSDIATGYNIVKDAINAPCKKILENCHVNALSILQYRDEVISKIPEKKNYGYDTNSEKLIDYLENGIIDPVKVTITALENALSVASSFLVTNSALVITKEDEFNV